jgi:outer membrane usher protein
MNAFHEAARPCAIFMTLAAAAVFAGARPAFADEQVMLSNHVLSRGTSQVDAAVITDDVKLTSTAIATLKTRDTSLTRLESAWTYDPDDSRFRLRLGDSTSDAGHWGSAVRFAGLQWGTGLAPRQDLLDAPRLALAGASIVPTVADAMLGAVNAPSAGFASRGLSTGKVLPSLAGMAFTTHDAAGRSTSLTRSLVAKPRQFDAGCRSYSLSFGRVRENYGLDESSYGPVFANTTVACGLGDGRSIEAHGEYLAGDATLAGLSLSQPVGNAMATVAAATSDNARGQGYQMQMGLQREVRRIAVGLQAQVQSPLYRDLGKSDVTDAVAQRMLASIATRFNDRSTLAFAYAMQRTEDQERADVVGVTQTLKFRTGGQISLVANHSVNDQRYSSVNLSFARALFY